MTATTTTAKFDAILAAEQLVRTEQALRAFAPMGMSDYRHQAGIRNLARAKASMWALISALTPAEQAAYGAYRAAALAA